MMIRSGEYEKTDNPIGYADYEATPHDILVKMVTRYPFEENDCFVDFGCGKGRVICFSAENGCKNVIGIEYNKKIFESLQKNIEELYRDTIRIFNLKAEDWRCAPETNKCYFYNPFYLKYFIKVLHNILNCSERQVIYLFLYDAAMGYQTFLSRQKYIRLTEVIKGNHGQGDLMIYTINRSML